MNKIQSHNGLPSLRFERDSPKASLEITVEPLCRSRKWSHRPGFYGYVIQSRIRGKTHPGEALMLKLVPEIEYPVEESTDVTFPRLKLMMMAEARKLEHWKGVTLA